MANFDSSNLKKIAVFTSGGDAPGMNATIRSVVRSALYQNLEVIGFIGGYEGLIQSNFIKLNLGSVANYIQRGGTFLKTGRCLEFHSADVRSSVAANLKALNIDGLICIGGDGSFTGAHALWVEHKVPVVGVPGTIDNDIFGTDLTIGFDTAVNTALQAIDKIRDTATSHDRLFIVEVMGRNSGFIASHVGLACGAEEVFTPEGGVSVDMAAEKIKRGQKRGKKSSIIITAEGQKPGRAYDLAESLRKKTGLDAKICILGHIQRGGAPTANDRILAGRTGSAAVNALVQGLSDIYVGVRDNKLITVNLEDGFSKKNKMDSELVDLTRILAH